MNLKYTRLGSYVLTAKFLHPGNDTEFQGLSRPSSIKLQNSEGPIWFSRTFQVLEKWKLFSKDLWPPCVHPTINVQFISGNVRSVIEHTDNPKLT